MKEEKRTVEVTVKVHQHSRGDQFTYESVFLNGNEMAKRGDKSIYVRPEYHERLTRIVQVIGEDRIPLYALLDHILTQHFEIYEDLLVKEFAAKLKPLF